MTNSRSTSEILFRQNVIRPQLVEALEASGMDFGAGWCVESDYDGTNGPQVAYILAPGRGIYSAPLALDATPEDVRAAIAAVIAEYRAV